MYDRVQKNTQVLLNLPILIQSASDSLQLRLHAALRLLQLFVQLML